MDENFGFGVPKDTSLSGWFNGKTGELFRGFPIEPTDIVLDAGCGDSPFIRFCGNRGAEVIVVDIDSEKVSATELGLKNTKARKVTPIVSDCNPIPLASESVDKVIALEVIEHVEDPEVFLAELVRVARPGASFLISAPDASSENMQKLGLAPDEYFQAPNHIRVLERVELVKLVEDAGLEILTQEFYGFYWSVWWAFFWVCKQELAPPWSPLLQNWTKTWSSLLELPDGARAKSALDKTMPKSQLIIARKPA